jgi:tripartite-type tricarboxylate transporter receptor subunit TctC
LPDLPTVAEAGIKGYESSTWYAIVAPAATPPDVLDKLYKEIASILKEPDVQRKFAQEGIDIIASTPPELKAFMQKEIDKWRTVVKTAGLAGS